MSKITVITESPRKNGSSFAMTYLLSMFFKLYIAGSLIVYLLDDLTSYVIFARKAVIRGKQAPNGASFYPDFIIYRIFGFDYDVTLLCV